MYKIAVLWPYDSIYGFSTLGLDIIPVQDAKTGAETLRKVADSAYAVIYITEGLAAELADEIEKYKEKMMPSIILIPGISGNTGVGVENVKKCVEKAVGSDIIFGEK